LSAHGDYAQILEWLKKMKLAPKQVFITHGEPAAAAAMVQHVADTLHWPARVPEYLETVVLK
jgi:metallo-beta-lactamase family protein